jgi:hypothetical protein
VGKVYNLCRVKTHVPAVLMVKSGLDPRIINKLEDELNRGLYLWFGICFCNIHFVVFNVGFGINLYLLYLSNQV